MSKLSEAIKELRIRNCESQDEFAKRMNVTRVAVTRWESGDALPSLRSARLLVESGLDVELVVGSLSPTRDAQGAA